MRHGQKTINAQRIQTRIPEYIALSYLLCVWLVFLAGIQDKKKGQCDPLSKHHSVVILLFRRTPLYMRKRNSKSFDSGFGRYEQTN